MVDVSDHQIDQLTPELVKRIVPIGSDRDGMTLPAQQREWFPLTHVIIDDEQLLRASWHIERAPAQASACRISFTSPVATSSHTSKLSRSPLLTRVPGIIKLRSTRIGDSFATAESKAARGRNVNWRF
jgi:hypothetical protein